MMVDALSAAGSQAAVQSGGKSSMALNSDEFLKIMITELTNQDPFEPMKNQELLNQMATIQQLQSSQDMSKSFKTLMEKYDSLLQREELGSASRMIGELVSGTSTSGDFVVGRVVAVNMDGKDILLELDTGQRINVKNMKRLGGSNSQDIVGEMIVGTDVAGRRVIGKVKSVEANKDGYVLHTQVAGEKTTVTVPLSQASIIKHDTADLLIGYTATSVDGVQGIVDSVEWADKNVFLNLVDAKGNAKQVPLEKLVSIY